MVKQKAKDVKEEVQEDIEEVYGEESISGSMPEPGSDDVLDELTGIKRKKKIKKDPDTMGLINLEEDE